MQNARQFTRTEVDEAQRMAVPRAKSKENQEEAGKYMGLCMNCEERKSCTFPKTHGGVWHCEEYK